MTKEEAVKFIIGNMKEDESKMLFLNYVSPGTLAELLVGLDKETVEMLRERVLGRSYFVFILSMIKDMRDTISEAGYSEALSDILAGFEYMQNNGFSQMTFPQEEKYTPVANTDRTNKWLEELNLGLQ